jgi:hypothetical protein
MGELADSMYKMSPEYMVVYETGKRCSAITRDPCLLLGIQPRGAARPTGVRSQSERDGKDEII